MSKLDDSSDFEVSGDDFQFGEEVLSSGGTGSKEDQEFDEMVGALQEILMDESFTEVQDGFFERYADKFTDDEENKIEYTSIFEEYTRLVEGTLEQKLSEKLRDFRMADFERLVSGRQDEIDPDMFDMLLSFTDFSEFKAQMLAYKTCMAPGGGLGVQGLHLGGTGPSPALGP